MPRPSRKTGESEFAYLCRIAENHPSQYAFAVQDAIDAYRQHAKEATQKADELEARWNRKHPPVRPVAPKPRFFLNGARFLRWRSFDV